mgnify:CR=1 FL=1
MTIVILIENVGVTMREGTSLNVLAWKTNLVTLVNQCSESKSLSGTPIDAFTILDGLLTSFENLGNLIVELTLISWEFSNFFTNLVEDCEVNTS